MKHKLATNRPYIFLLLLLPLLFTACKQDDVIPKNPYDDVDYGDDTDVPFDPDGNTITGIYESIIKVKCNVPGCHDGHFEPDFRTIQSAWSTLVYHDVVKNTPDSAYDYRVVPYDTSASMLWRRLTQGDAQLQQMPATGLYLSEEEKGQISSWIYQGARDMAGNLPVLPNDEPRIFSAAYDNNFTQQLDLASNRLGGIAYNPFKLNQNITFNMIMLIEDDSTAIPDMQVNQLKLSLDMDDFSNATTVQAYYLGSGPNQFWVANVSTAPYAAGDTVFMRYYVNDGDHSFVTEFPRDDSDDPYKTFSSFYINP